MQKRVVDRGVKKIRWLDWNLDQVERTYSPNNNAPYNDCEKDVAEFNKIKETIEKMVQKIFKKQKNQVLYYFEM